MENLKASVAQRIILESVATLGVESVKMERSLGRVLAEDIKANRDLPPYDVSAMDGFAVRSADVANPPASLEFIEEIQAGSMPTKTVQAGQCARIMTGAPMPQGADAVIRVEDTQVVSGNTPLLNPLPQAGEEANEKSHSFSDRVQFAVAVKPGNYIRPHGEHMHTGDIVLKEGTEITPGVIGVLATVKAAQFSVYRLPRVAILSTGNELEGMSEPVDLNKIPDSNTYAVMAQVQALGIEPALLGIAPDNPEELEQYLQRGLEYDMLLVSGGTSMGEYDYVRPCIEKLGVKMIFWRVLTRPGHPLTFGKTDKTVVFGLPGYPVSSMVCFEEFVLPALRQMMGNQRLHRRTVTARMAHPVKTQPGRTEFIRVLLTHTDAGYIVNTTGTQSSGVLLSMARADGLMVVPADCTGLAEGDQVTVQLLDGSAFQEKVCYKE